MIGAAAVGTRVEELTWRSGALHVAVEVSTGLLSWRHFSGLLLLLLLLGEGGREGSPRLLAPKFPVER